MPFPPPPRQKSDLENGTTFAPRFDDKGLITCVTVEASTGEILMVAHMNEEALEATLRTGIAHYWSRSRGSLWKKGETSGQIQRVTEMRTDCDQDAVVIRVEVGGDGGACHTGRKSCFYRVLAPDGSLRITPDEQAAHHPPPAIPARVTAGRQ